MKNTLYFSKKCEHSKNVIDAIQRKNLVDAFVFICIDSIEVRRQLPREITLCPSVVTSDRRLISGDDIYKLLPQDEISPFTTNLTTDYTWLTENAYDDGKIMENNKNYNFTLLNSPVQANNTNGNQPMFNEDVTGKNKFDDSNYEKFLNSRANDDKFFQNNGNKNPNSYVRK